METGAICLDNALQCFNALTGKSFFLPCRLNFSSSIVSSPTMHQASVVTHQTYLSSVNQFYFNDWTVFDEKALSKAGVFKKICSELRATCLLWDLQHFKGWPQVPPLTRNWGTREVSSGIGYAAGSSDWFYLGNSGKLGWSLGAVISFMALKSWILTWNLDSSNKVRKPLWKPPNIIIREIFLYFLSIPSILSWQLNLS